MAFRPKLIPTLFTVPAVITMLFLGFWQVDRLVWKEALIERLHERATGEATDLTPGAKDEEADEFRRVRLSGTFDHENEFLLVNRSLNGNPGMHILTPLTRSDGGGHVLINRGWVPFDKVEIAARAAAHAELRFRDEEGRELFVYGAATAVDANGATRAMTTAFDGERITLRLAGDWLADAVYPVVVDPMLGVGNWVTHADPIGDVDVVRDSESTAQAVWVAYSVFFSGSDGDVYFQRFHDDGSQGALVFQKKLPVVPE